MTSESRSEEVCPTCGGCDGWIRKDDDEPIWFACRRHEVRWAYTPSSDDDDNRFPGAAGVKVFDAVVPIVLGYRIVEGATPSSQVGERE